MKSVFSNRCALATENLTVPLFLFYFLARPFIILLHELGHAVFIVLFSKSKVIVYVGSLGNASNCFSFTIGLFEFHLKRNPFLWNKGLCTSEQPDIPLHKQIIYTLAGPLTPFITGLLLITSATIFHFPTYPFIFCVSFLIGSIIDLFINLVPKSKPVTLHKGTPAYNDGYTLLFLLKQRKYAPAFTIGIKAFNNKQYDVATATFTEVLATHSKDKYIYQLTIHAYLLANDYNNALFLYKTFESTFKQDANDYCTGGLIYSKLLQHDTAIVYYDMALKTDPLHLITLNNKGYTLNVTECYSEAITLFDKAIKINPTYAYSLNNRGLAKLKSGFEQEGLKDIQYSLSLDESNSYAYRNLGIYHFDKKEYKEALDLFLKAKVLDPKTDLIDALIIQAENKSTD